MSANGKYVAERAASLCANSVPTLRQRAEGVLLENGAQSPQDLAALSPEATQRTLHELRVHQIELEMQNEELRRVQIESVSYTHLTLPTNREV